MPSKHKDVRNEINEIIKKYRKKDSEQVMFKIITSNIKESISTKREKTKPDNMRKKK